MWLALEQYFVKIIQKYDYTIGGKCLTKFIHLKKKLAEIMASGGRCVTESKSRIDQVKCAFQKKKSILSPNIATNHSHRMSERDY